VVPHINYWRSAVGECYVVRPMAETYIIDS
jgi:hypothetical protein